MATSGTAAFNLDIIDIIEDAYEIAVGEAKGGYDLKTARRSLDLLTKEWGNRGLNMWTMRQGMVSVTAGDNSVTLPNDTIDILDAVWRTGSGTAQNDTTLTRISGSQWTAIAYKNQTGTPTQFYVQRVQPPLLKLWPTPATDGIIVAWGMRTIEDTGKYINTMDISPRFLPALVCGLAYYLSLKTPAAADRVPMLQAEYERQFELAAEEDRDRSSFRLVPDLSSYNR
jgi:hypothetical protein